MKYYKELIILEGLIFLSFWLTNEYLAFLLSMVCIPIFAGILIVAMISERIEKSKITPDFFKLLVGLTVIPLILLTIFWSIAGGDFAWMKS
jgi:hypothetical protein